VTTIGAPVRPRSGGRPAPAIAELALPALTVVSGLQLLRLMVSMVVGVYRDRFEAPLVNLALFAVLVVGLGFLAGPAARLLGRRRLLVVSAGGVAAVRLVLQLVPEAVARWLLAAAGVVLFLWFVPAWLARGARGFGPALLVGLALDTALAGLGGSWDYAWSITTRTVVLAGLLAAAALWALAALPDPGPGPSWGRGGRWARVAPLAGIGPTLFLHALVWQNLGWQAVLSGRTQAQAFLLVMAANLAGLAAGTATALAGEVRRPAVVAALAGLAVAVALGQKATTAACVLGQAAAAVLLVAILRRATEPGEERDRGEERDLGDGHGLGAVAVAWTAGMELYVLLVLVYYAAYDVVLPVGNGFLPVLAAALLGLAGVVAVGGAGRPGPNRGAGNQGAVETRRRPPGSSATLPTGAPTTGGGLGGAATLPTAEPATGGGLGGTGALPAGDLATGGRLSGAVSLPAGDPATGGGPRATAWTDLVPVGVGMALLLAPLLFWVTAPDPVAAVPDQGAGPARPVQVLSWNLHFGFDVRGWSDLEATTRAIEASGAEVVGLQEVSRGWYVNGSTDMLAWLQRRLRMPYARFAGASDAIWGNAVLSRHPIVADQVVRLPREGVPLRRNALLVEVDLGAGRRLRVAVTHLHHVEGPDGARVRLAQLPPLLNAVAGRPATVLMGDLNARPGSAEIALVERAGLTDAFAAGGGRPADELTWPSDRPNRRIDYIWLSGDLAAAGFVATASTASDHRGVAVTVRPA
jgi:endonuclease/exonuclease/phosphatase family metal-dependent hydrolase